jgi:hypothetical protein
MVHFVRGRGVIVVYAIGYTYDLVGHPMTVHLLVPSQSIVPVCRVGVVCVLCCR